MDISLNKKRLLLAIGAGLLPLFIASVLYAVFLSPHSEKIALHSNQLEVDFLGYSISALKVILVAFFLSIINLMLAIYTFQRIRPLFYFFISFNVLFGLLILIYIGSIIRIN